MTFLFYLHQRNQVVASINMIDRRNGEQFSSIILMRFKRYFFLTRMIIHCFEFISIQVLQNYGLRSVFKLARMTPRVPIYMSLVRSIGFQLRVYTNQLLPLLYTRFQVNQQGAVLVSLYFVTNMTRELELGMLTKCLSLKLHTLKGELGLMDFLAQ